MAHGKSDPIIPYALGRASAQQLTDAGYSLEWHDYAMPHSVCQEEVSDMERWLGKQTGARGD